MNSNEMEIEVGHGMSRMPAVAVSTLATGFRWALMALMGLTVSIMAWGLWTSPAAGAVIEIADACDVLVVPAADVEAPVPAGVVGANAGDTVKLTGDSVCFPSFEIDFDKCEAELTAGNGITIEVDDVTLDLNGRSITSFSDVAADADAAGAGTACEGLLDVENAGIAVGGVGVTVKNDHETDVSAIDNFTANIDWKTRGPAHGLLTGKVTAGQCISRNIFAGDAHGGGAMAIDKTSNLTIDCVELSDTTGDNGIDLKKCGSSLANPVIIKNSVILGKLTGIRVRECDGVTLDQNNISSPEGNGIELLQVKNDFTISNNTIHDNAFLGIGVSASEDVEIKGDNTFAGNGFADLEGGCDVEIDDASRKITVEQNTASSGADLLPGVPPGGAKVFNQEAACLGGS